MNQSNFNQTGGYPLKTERLQELQTAFTIFNSFGALAGNLAIVSGCELVGTTIGDGFVYIDGELLEFRTGTVATSVIIIEEPVNREFENATMKTVHTIRYATFGTADTSWLWADFKRVDSIVDLMIRLTTVETKLATIAEGADKTILYRGTYNLGNSSGSVGVGVNITMPDVGTSNYLVMGTFRTTTGSTFYQITFKTDNHTNTSFHLSSSWDLNTEQKYFDFVIVPN